MTSKVILGLKPNCSIFLFRAIQLPGSGNVPIGNLFVNYGPILFPSMPPRLKLELRSAKVVGSLIKVICKERTETHLAQLTVA